jgi:hypothetical protein
MRLPVVVLSMAMLAACGSGGGTRPANVAPAEVTVNLAAPIFFGAGTSAPAAVDVTVRNRATVPIQVRRIRLSATSSMTDYTLRPMERMFNEALPPGTSKTFSISTTAIAARAGITPSEPITIRTEISLEANGSPYREIFTMMGVVP